MPALLEPRIRNLALSLLSCVALACGGESFKSPVAQPGWTPVPYEPGPDPTFARYAERDRSPYQAAGIFSGRMYGAFEAAWYQDFEEIQFWTFRGPGAKQFWDLWETQKVIPPAYREWQETGDEPDPSVSGEDWYPYLCAETVFRGEWRRAPEGIIPDQDFVLILEMLEVTPLDLGVDDCIPAAGALFRGEWPTSARARRITSP